MVDDDIELSGFTNRNNTRRATRLDLAPQGFTEWRLTGFVSEATPVGFSIGFQPILLLGITPTNCGKALTNGDFVEVTAVPTENFSEQLVLSTVTAVRCLKRGLSGPPVAVIPASIEGFVTSVGDDGNFVVADQPIIAH